MQYKEQEKYEYFETFSIPIFINGGEKLKEWSLNGRCGHKKRPNSFGGVGR